MALLEELVADIKTLAQHDDETALDVACEELITHLTATLEPVKGLEARNVLKSLRSNRRFPQLRRVANAFLIDGSTDPLVMHHLAQGMIETGELMPAIRFLEHSVADRSTMRESEWGEMKGALGRAWKDLAIRSANLRPELARKAVEESYKHYLDAWVRDPEKFTYQGINMIAVAHWDKETGLPSGTVQFAESEAAKIVNVLGKREVRDPNKRSNKDTTYLENWDFATLGEAYLSLGDLKNAQRWYGKYAKAEESAFALSSSIRQLQQLWRADESDWCDRLLAPLIGKLGATTGGTFSVDPSTLQRLSKVSKSQHQAIVGDAGPLTHDWLQKANNAARAVASVLKNGSALGSGFAVRLSSILNCTPEDFPFAGFVRDEIVVVTNAHVVSAAGYPKAATPNEATVEFALLPLKDNARQSFSVKSVLWESNPNAHDAAILRLRPFVPEAVSPLDLHWSLPELKKGHASRVNIIGHPFGREISYSFQGNELLDYETSVYEAAETTDPCPIHYKTPTENGSSGSPVFDHIWRLIGVHHAGSRFSTVTKLNGKSGTYAANVGHWVESMRRAAQADLTA